MKVKGKRHHLAIVIRRKLPIRDDQGRIIRYQLRTIVQRYRRIEG